MDRSKAKLIVEARLEEAKCCLTCENWSIGTTRSRWGNCRIHRYTHEKHQRGHGMPAPPTGVCPSWTRAETQSDVQSFLELARDVAVATGEFCSCGAALPVHLFDVIDCSKGYTHECSCGRLFDGSGGKFVQTGRRGAGGLLSDDPPQTRPQTHHPL